MRILNIALMTREFEDPHTSALCQGVAQAIRERGHHLFIFPGKFLLEMDIDDFAYHDKCLLQFASDHHVDIAIVNLGNIAPNFNLEEKKKFLNSFNIPVILIADNIEGYSCVNFDNSTGLHFGIEHMIRVHNKKFFGYVSGPMQNLDAAQRCNVFKKCMSENGFTSEQYRIVEGDFTYNCKGVIRQLIEDFPQIDVLVCANDMMCFGAYEVLKEKGLVLGKDIGVMGFDDVPYASQIVPGLTTVNANAATVGYEAVKICENVMKREHHNLIVDTSFVVRESCGCAYKRSEEIRTSLELQANIEAMNYCLVELSRIVVNNKEKNNELYSRIIHALARLNVNSIYMYIYEKEINHQQNKTWETPETVLLKAYFEKGANREPITEYRPMPIFFYPVKEEQIVVIPEEKQRVSFNNILKNEHTQHMTNGIRMLTLLYAGETQYGFVLWEIEEDYLRYVGPLSLQISNCIKTNRLLETQSLMTNELEKAFQQVNEKNAMLEEISKIDELTQIYNRRGFLDHMKRNVIAQENQGQPAITIYADMDNLKKINDRFGHEEGDYALYSIGQVLRKVTHRIKGTRAVGRIGGDEFCAYIISDDIQVEEFRHMVKNSMEEINKNNGKPYYIDVSIGVKCFVCSPDIDISQELEMADKQLYEFKKQKRTDIMK